MSNICNGCAAPEDKQNKPGLICGACTGFTHLCCLSGQGTPGELAGDVFFDYTCLNCSKDKRELFTRTRLQWVNVVYLTLYYFNIHWYGISNRGFFHYKTHVCSFIDRHWNELFEPKFKQKKNWIGTIAGVLSIYNNTIFRSGSTVLGETGWWRLQHAFSPAVAAHILQEVSRDKEKHKGRAKSHVAMEKNLFFDKVLELGYKDLLADGNEARRPPSIEPAPKKRRVDSDELSCVSTSTYSEHVDPDIKTEAPEDVTLDYLSTSLLKDGGYSDAEATFRGFDFPPVNVIPPSDSSSLHSHQHSQNYDSDTGSSSHPQQDASDENDEKHAARKPDAKSKRSAEDKAKDLKRDSLFSVQLNSVTMPWLPEKPPEVNKELVEMTEYEEVQLLKQVEGLIPKVRDANKKAALRRFRAGLALRRLKRHKHLPIFDLDTSMKVLGGYITEDAKVVTNTERVLDRFQRNYLLANLCGTVHSGGAATLLAGGVPAPLRSPYSGAQLKPYIRRDTAARPLWLRLTEELLLKANRKNPSFVLPARAALEYSYVRPHHIAAVNWLCAQHFWPGVDLTESLQYPEYSCVVTHRRLVVGCAFLVPDVARTEAYISFILTRPEWRGAGIGTFMLYHLLQTCTGKDVTLHVSPTNPAIFLYQKFGFKVEELIQDFYEKYYDIDFKGCRHALFLRLTR